MRHDDDRQVEITGALSTAPPSYSIRSSIPEIGLLSPDLFETFRRLVFEASGISLNDQKRLMLSVRITKRLRALGLSDFAEYLAYIHDAPANQHELRSLLNVVTTNKTDFFREPYHFDFLSQTLLPRLAPELRPRGAPINVWSAGCATGEEPYTLAFVLSDFFSGDVGRFRILATDLSTDTLKTAVKAVYPTEAVKPIPSHFRLKYMTKGEGEWRGYWRVAKQIRDTVQFGRLNFNDEVFGIPDKMHIVFCRNVIIYFSHETKARVVAKIRDQLVPGGYLFVGHSETLSHLSSGFESAFRTVYRKIE